MASPLAAALDKDKEVIESGDGKEAESTMAYEYTQENFWDGTTFYQQDPITTPHDNGFYETGPMGMMINTSPQYTHGLTGESSRISFSDWGGSIQGDMISGGDFSPGTTISDKSTPFSEKNTRSSVSTGPRRPSAEAIARRRKQNRVSQAAWRARNKELVEELRQEISEYSEHNQMMQETMQSLLKTTESLKGVIEHALAIPAPKGSQEGKGACNGEGQLLSPASDGGGSRDVDAPHDP